MGELFLSVFGVAAAIAIVFYNIGKAAGTRVALSRTYQTQIKSLTDAMDNVTSVLNKERERADFYKTLHHTDVKESIVTHQILGEMVDFFNEFRGDLVEADTFNRVMLERMNSTQLFNKTSILMIGEQLERSDFKMSSEEYTGMSDSYRNYDRQEEKSDIEFASSQASRKRQEFMETVEQEIVG